MKKISFLFRSRVESKYLEFKKCGLKASILKNLEYYAASMKH